MNQDFFFQCIFFLTSYNGAKHCLFSADGPAKHAENAAGSNNNPKNSWPLYLAFTIKCSLCIVTNKYNYNAVIFIR